MPNLEPVVINGITYRVRHVGVPAVIYPRVTTPISPEKTVLGTTLVGRPLPASALPNSGDWIQGSWTGRLGDAGECQIIFPNARASDGPQWRERFDPTGHLEFLEIYCNDELDSVCCIDTVAVDQTQVTVHGQDGWFLLKKAYERDLIIVGAPRDVVERATKVWVPTVVDNFAPGSLSNVWTSSIGTGAALSIGNNGGLNLSIGNGAGDGPVEIDSSAVSVDSSTNVWSTTCLVSNLANEGSANYVRLRVIESSGTIYEMRVYYTSNNGNFVEALENNGTVSIGSCYITAATTVSLLFESDGQWIWAYANGQLIGVMRRVDAATTTLQTEVWFGPGAQQVGSVTIGNVYTRALQPFLMRGTDKGDYVLPGDANTFPSGGLHGRYYNDNDLQNAGATNYLAKVLAPTRSQAYGASTPAEYQNQQDATISGQVNPTPGAATTGWSVKWFGAIYLKLSAGNYTFRIDTPGGGSAGAAVRVWIGNLQWGAQILDQWTFAGSTQYTFTLTAANLAGTLSYGGGTAVRDGWYPIRIEYAINLGNVGMAAPIFRFITVPASYTDPGGTSISSGSQTTVVPATSLSPLGCVDQRYQGTSHYDLAQQTVQAYGHQASVEPQSLESGLFPGVLAPRIREGGDTDIVLNPDTGPRTDGEGMLNFSSTLDATDAAAELQGNGAGFQNGTTGQLQADIFDPPTIRGSLFAVQGWQDFSDASFVQLLQALLNTQLGQQLSPWQLLSADPQGAPRRAFTWPLPGSLRAMRWRPGDGLRIQAREINVWDTTPRQMLVVTRNITPQGTSSMNATFANRPRNEAHTLRQQLRAATRPLRNYQRQLVTLSGNAVSSSLGAGATDTASSVVNLLPSDRIVAAYVRVNTFSGTSPSLGIHVNGVDQTSALAGPWSAGPLMIPIGPVAQVSSVNNLYVQATNKNVTNTLAVQYQLFVDVLR